MRFPFGMRALVEAGDIPPALASSYSLEELREAQSAFIAKRRTGNIVVCP